MVDPGSVLLAASPLLVILFLIAGMRLSDPHRCRRLVWTAAVAILALRAGRTV
jgi:hypothetical protein